jgi:hypothetical protein
VGLVGEVFFFFREGGEVFKAVRSDWRKSGAVLVNVLFWTADLLLDAWAKVVRSVST